MKKSKCKICVALRSYLPSSVTDVAINEAHLNNGHKFSNESLEKMKKTCLDEIEELFDRLDEVI